MNAPPATRQAHELASYLSERTGISFRGARGSWLNDVLRTNGQPDSATSWSVQLDGDEETFRAWCDRVTVQESFFFREPAKLEYLRSEMLPQLARAGREVRVWSAGCARGEEAYSLSMLMSWAGLDGRYRVVGTDLSPTAVERAESGVYGRWALRGMEPDTLRRGFLRHGSGYRVRDEFRRAVSFQHHNLLEKPPAAAGHFDVILCRNVLIYFSADAVRHVATALTAALAPGGWLITSASDPILDDVPGLEPVLTGHGLVYRRRPSAAHAGPRTARDVVRAAAAEGRSAAPSAQQPSGQIRPAEPETAAQWRRERRTARERRPTAATEPPELVVQRAQRALDMALPHQARELAARLLGGVEEPAGHRIIVQALVQEGRLSEAVDAATRAVGSCPSDAEAHHLHAVVLLETGQAAEARDAARRAIYLDPRLPLAHLLLARILESMGDQQGSRRARRNGERMLREVQRDAG